jgi:Tfp pilus assembly protein PilF
MPRFESSAGRRQLFLMMLLLGTLVLGALQLYEHKDALLALVSLDPASSSNQGPKADTMLVEEFSRDQWRESFRLEPDRRFLQAFSEVDRLSAEPSDAARATAEWGEGKMWVVSHRGEQVARLDPLPNVDSLIGLVGSHAAKRRDKAQAVDAAKLAEIRALIGQFHPPKLFDALRRLDALCANRAMSAPVALEAARALSYLLIQVRDPLEYGDAVAARAIAALALAQVDPGVSRGDLREVEAMLTTSLGYSGHARALAKDLGADSPIAAFLARNTPGLEQLAEDRELARFLLLRLAQERGDSALWISTARRFYDQKIVSSSALSTSVSLVSFRTTPAVESRVRDMMVDELEGGSQSVDASELPIEARSEPRRKHALKALLAELETFGASDGDDLDDAISHTRPDEDGTLWDAELVERYARAVFMGSYYREAVFYLDALASPAIAKRFIDDLDEEGTSPEPELKRFFGARMSAASQKADAGKLEEALARESVLGGEAMLSAYADLAGILPWGDARAFQVARLLHAHLDSRLVHRAELTWQLYAHAWEIPAADRLVLSLMQSAPVGFLHTTSWYAQRNQDVDALEAMMIEASTTTEELAPLVAAYSKLEQADPQVVRRQFERLVKVQPSRWSVRRDYSEYLFEQEAYREAETVVESWRRDHGPGIGLQRVFAHTRLSKARRLRGDLDGAWSAIKDIISSGQAGAVAEAAHVLAANDQLERAEDLYRKALERYPTTTWVRATLLEFLWTHERHQDAAQVIKEAPSQHDYEWGRYGDAFFEAFTERDASSVASALDALTDAGLPALKLGMLAGEFAKNGQPLHAFEVNRRVEHTKIMSSAEHVVRTYKHLAEARGEAQARQWLDKKAGRFPTGVMTMMVYQDGLDDLLWGYFGEPGNNDVGHSMWLFRAAAFLKSDDPDPDRRAQLEAYFSQDSSNWYFRLARLVWGDEPEDEMISDAKSKKKQCELAYWMGLRAQLDQDYAGASDWYHVTILTGASNNGEYHWALDELYGWVHGREDYTLARLEREKPL